MNLTFKNIRLILTLSLLSIVSTSNSFAQCGSVVKEAISKLTVYNHTGQTNSAKIESGNKVEMHLAFYRGMNYKLQFAAEKTLGQYTFRILDENKKELYKFDGTQADYFTFFSNSSQELIIEVSAVDETKKGCVAVAVGMQPPKKVGSIRNL